MKLLHITRWFVYLSVAIIGGIALSLPLRAEEENALVAVRDFRVMPTPHFDIFITNTKLVEQARLAGRVLEGARDDFLDRMGIAPPAGKISVFLYESWGNFQRSSIAASFGKFTRFGFSEPLKNRVVVWLSPSEREFIYALRANLAQMLMLQYLFPNQGPRLFMRYIYSDWMICGLPLYLAGDYDPFGRMALQDALFSGNLRPLAELKGDVHLQPHELREAYAYMIEVFRFLETRYGSDKIRLLVKKLREGLGFYVTDTLLTEVYGFDEHGLHAIVTQQLKAQWQPEVQGKSLPSSWQRLTYYERYYRHWDIAPAIAPDGHTIAFFSDRGDIFKLYQMDADGRGVCPVIWLGHGWTIEGLDGLESPPAYSPDGQTILVKGQSGHKNSLFLVGRGMFASNSALPGLEFDDYAGAAFAPDGHSIVLAGVRAGKSELYRYRLADQHVERLTSDGLAKFQPKFSTDGSQIIYVAEYEGERDLCLLPVAGGQSRRLEKSGSDEAYPQFLPDGSLLCTTTRGNSWQLARCNLADPKAPVWQALSDIPFAILTPAVASDGQWVYFAYYVNGRPQIYKAPLASLPPLPQADVPATTATMRLTMPKLTTAAEAAQWQAMAYSAELSSDFIFPFLAVNALRFSDTTGLHSIHSQFGLFSGFVFDPAKSGTGKAQADVSFGIGGQITYTFASFLSFTLFGNLDYVEPDDKDADRSWDYKAGGRVSASVPLNRRLSLVGGYTLFHRKESVDHQPGFRHHYWTGGVFIGLELDNTNRRGLDPTGGYAADLTLSVFNRVLGSDYDYQVLTAQARYYWSFYEDHILMFRWQGSIAHEDVPFLYDLGGSGNLRGLSTDKFKGTERWVATVEYRFPIYRDWNFHLLGLIKDIRGFAFVETGSVTRQVISRCTDWDQMDLAYTVGGGIRIDYYFLQHFALPLILQVGKRLDEPDKAVFYFGISRKF